MTDLISSVDALLSYAGATLFVLGLLSCFYPRTFKLGVVAMLLANVPLALAIAFPDNVVEWALNYGLVPENFPEIRKGHAIGIATGVLCYLVLFLCYWYLLGGRHSNASYCFWRKPKTVLTDDDQIFDEHGDFNTGDASKSLRSPRGRNRQSASVLHLNSNDNPISLKGTRASDSFADSNGLNQREPTLNSELLKQAQGQVVNSAHGRSKAGRYLGRRKTPKGLVVPSSYGDDILSSTEHGSSTSFDAHDDSARLGDLGFDDSVASQTRSGKGIEPRFGMPDESAVNAARLSRVYGRNRSAPDFSPSISDGAIGTAADVAAEAAVSTAASARSAVKNEAAPDLSGFLSRLGAFTSNKKDQDSTQAAETAVQDAVDVKKDQDIVSASDENAEQELKLESAQDHHELGDLLVSGNKVSDVLNALSGDKSTLARIKAQVVPTEERDDSQDDSSFADVLSSARKRQDRLESSIESSALTADFEPFEASVSDIDVEELELSDIDTSVAPKTVAEALAELDLVKQVEQEHDTSRHEAERNAARRRVMEKIADARAEAAAETVVAADASPAVGQDAAAAAADQATAVADTATVDTADKQAVVRTDGAEDKVVSDKSAGESGKAVKAQSADTLKQEFEAALAGEDDDEHIGLSDEAIRLSRLVGKKEQAAKSAADKADGASVALASNDAVEVDRAADTKTDIEDKLESISGDWADDDEPVDFGDMDELDALAEDNRERNKTQSMESDEDEDHETEDAEKVSYHPRTPDLTPIFTYTPESVNPDIVKKGSSDPDPAVEVIAAHPNANVDPVADMPNLAFGYITRPQNIPDAKGFSGAKTNYSFDINVKSQPLFPVEGFIDKATYVAQSRYTASFHDEELSSLMRPHLVRPVRMADVVMQQVQRPGNSGLQERRLQQQLQQAAPGQRALQEQQAQMRAQQAQVAADHRAREERLQRQQLILERAQRVAQAMREELAAELVAVQNNDFGQHHLPYALTSSYTDANQDEAKALAALLQRDTELARSILQDSGAASPAASAAPAAVGSNAPVAQAAAKGIVGAGSTAAPDLHGQIRTNVGNQLTTAKSSRMLESFVGFDNPSLKFSLEPVAEQAVTRELEQSISLQVLALDQRLPEHSPLIAQVSGQNGASAATAQQRKLSSRMAAVRIKDSLNVLSQQNVIAPEANVATSFPEVVGPLPLEAQAGSIEVAAKSAVISTTLPVQSAAASAASSASVSASASSAGGAAATNAAAAPVPTAPAAKAAPTERKRVAETAGSKIATGGAATVAVEKTMQQIMAPVSEPVAAEISAAPLTVAAAASVAASGLKIIPVVAPVPETPARSVARQNEAQKTAVRGMETTFGQQDRAAQSAEGIVDNNAADIAQSPVRIVVPSDPATPLKPKRILHSLKRRGRRSEAATAPKAAVAPKTKATAVKALESSLVRKAAPAAQAAPAAPAAPVVSSTAPVAPAAAMATPAAAAVTAAVPAVPVVASGARQVALPRNQVAAAATVRAAAVKTAVPTTAAVKAAASSMEERKKASASAAVVPKIQAAAPAKPVIVPAAKAVEEKVASALKVKQKVGKTPAASDVGKDSAVKTKVRASLRRRTAKSATAEVMAGSTAPAHLAAAANSTETSSVPAAKATVAPKKAAAAKAAAVKDAVVKAADTKTAAIAAAAAVTTAVPAADKSGTPQPQRRASLRRRRPALDSKTTGQK